MEYCGLFPVVNRSSISSPLAPVFTEAFEIVASFNPLRIFRLQRLRLSSDFRKYTKFREFYEKRGTIDSRMQLGNISLEFRATKPVYCILYWLNNKQFCFFLFHKMHKYLPTPYRYCYLFTHHQISCYMLSSLNININPLNYYTSVKSCLCRSVARIRSGFYPICRWLV